MKILRVLFKKSQGCMKMTEGFDTFNCTLALSRELSMICSIVVFPKPCSREY